MKKYILSLFLSVILSGICYSQKFQATLKSGADPFRPDIFKLVLKPDVALNNAKVGNVVVAIGIKNDITPKPTLIIRNNFFNFLTYTLVPPKVETVAGKGEYYTYPLSGIANQDDANLRNFAAGVEVDWLELEFDGGPLPLAEILLLNVPEGGNTGFTQFYISSNGSDRVNQSSMFFGTGATNSAAGYDGTAFVPLGNVSLPVKFLSFYALKNGDNAKLNWTVENDGDNKHFEIERSLNGRQFAPVTMVNALGNGKSINTYETIDPALSNLGSKTVFYRIKQIDKNNTITYSDIRNLNISSASTAAQLFPNPARTFTKLVFDAPEQGKVSLVIRDATGKTIQMLNSQFVKGLNNQDINVSLLAAGKYNLTILGKDYSETIKFTKVQ